MGKSWYDTFHSVWGTLQKDSPFLVKARTNLLVGVVFVSPIPLLIGQASSLGLKMGKFLKRLSMEHWEIGKSSQNLNQASLEHLAGTPIHIFLWVMCIASTFQRLRYIRQSTAKIRKSKTYIARISSTLSLIRKSFTPTLCNTFMRAIQDPCIVLSSRLFIGIFSWQRRLMVLSSYTISWK